MPRSRSRSRGSSGGGGGLFGGFGGRSQSRGSTPPASAPSRQPAQRSSSPPARQQAPQQQSGGGGGLLSGIGSTIAQGMAFGGGSAVAHRAVDAVAGPRQVEHVHSGGEEGQQPAQQQAGAAQEGIGGQDCAQIQQEMNRCFETNSHDISICQQYVDMFKECQQQQQDFR
eukprot:gb/GECG01016079.1/.p1 GENE.gb/GECG01016079.1/~~gb/GECG01016079.1/.p1  ORF type:complete len:170 (+),score=30.50 gb/GECG01016079.1/:1-510(+)